MHKKPLLLVFPFGLLSHYLRCIAICRQFESVFDIRFQFYDAYHPFVTRAGFGLFHCSHINAVNAIEKVKRFDFSWLNEHSLFTQYKSQVDIIRSLKPAAILSDNAFTIHMAATKTNVPHAAIINGYMSLFYAREREMPSMHPYEGLVKLFPPQIRNALIAKGERLSFSSLAKPFQSIRKKESLPQTNHYLEEMTGNITLITDLQRLFPQKNLPPSYKVIGPVYEESGNNKDELRLTQYKPRIFVTMGSSGDWQKVKFLNDPAFAQFEIVAAGDIDRVLRAEHILHKKFIEPSSILPETDLVICHGGNGTIYHALRFGIPILSCPVHMEQEWNAAAVMREGLGETISPNLNVYQHLTLIRNWIERKAHWKFNSFKSSIAEAQQKQPAILEEVKDRLLMPYMHGGKQISPAPATRMATLD